MVDASSADSLRGDDTMTCHECPFYGECDHLHVAYLCEKIARAFDAGVASVDTTEIVIRNRIDAYNDGYTNGKRDGAASVDSQASSVEISNAMNDAHNAGYTMGQNYVASLYRVKRNGVVRVRNHFFSRKHVPIVRHEPRYPGHYGAFDYALYQQ